MFPRARAQLNILYQATLRGDTFLCRVHMCSKPQLDHYATALNVSTLKTFCKRQKHLIAVFTILI